MTITKVLEFHAATVLLNDGRNRWNFYYGYVPENRKNCIALTIVHQINYEGGNDLSIIQELYESKTQMVEAVKMRIKCIIADQRPDFKRQYKWVYENG